MNLTRKDVNCGDEVWAYKLEPQRLEMGCMLAWRYRQKPVQGRLVRHYNDIGPENFKGDGSYVKYFVPYRKGTKDLAWSKAVEFRHRRYAWSQSEAIDLYNKEVDDLLKNMDEIKHIIELERI